MKKIFKHIGRGYYVGSCIIVKCNDIEEAKIRIREILDSVGLKKEELDIEECKEDIIHIHDGDY